MVIGNENEITLQSRGTLGVVAVEAISAVVVEVVEVAHSLGRKSAAVEAVAEVESNDVVVELLLQWLGQFFGKILRAVAATPGGIVLKPEV